MFTIVHAGQTGVERGAHHAALTSGLFVSGFMPHDGRDELGPVPPEVSAHLSRFKDRGTRAAVGVNLAISAGALFVVPDADTARAFPAMGWVLVRARALKLPYLIVDPESMPHTVASWAQRLPPFEGVRRLCVTGPRATRWQHGAAIAKRLVSALAIHSTSELEHARALTDR